MRWLGETDVTGVALDDIVFIEEGDVSVYVDDNHVAHHDAAAADTAKAGQGSNLEDSGGHGGGGMGGKPEPKPAVGTKLNKPAVVVLERIFPPAGVRPYVFARELEKSLESVGAWSVEYDAANGKWAFTVPHFSL